MSSQDLVNEKIKSKKKFELTYLKENIVNYLAFLEQNPIEHSNLKSTLYKLLSEIDYNHKLLDGFEPPAPFELPEGYREKLEKIVIQNFVDGRD